MTQVVHGMEVSILYTAKLQDGTIFDSTENNNPFIFTVGSHDIIKGINNAVIGMESGQKKTVEIQPNDAYGNYNNELLFKVAREKLPQGIVMGDILTDTENNRWWVRNIIDENVILDGNHPLAGQVLIFEIELVAIS